MSDSSKPVPSRVILFYSSILLAFTYPRCAGKRICLQLHTAVIDGNFLDVLAHSESDSSAEILPVVENGVSNMATEDHFPKDLDVVHENHALS